MNPQIRFGEDLMSRVSYVHDAPGRRSRTDAQPCARGINELIGEYRRQAGIDADDILELTRRRQPDHASPVPGPGSRSELGGAPFALATDAAMNLRARDLDLRVNPGANVYRAALHRRTRRRRCGRGDPRRAAGPRRRDHAARRRRHQRRDRARQSRPPAGLLQSRPDRLSRGPRSPAVSGPRPARSNACASIPTRSNRGSA